MDPILCGTETEYGFHVEGIGAEELVDASAALVRSYPGERLSIWNDAFESPRRDLRGFQLERLAFDPVDAAFDVGRNRTSIDRADQVLANGARFYNDHGHPEYSTPECNDVFQAALQDRVGEHATLLAAEAYAKQVGRPVRIIKNNTDYHGASYGTHESYSVPRSLGWEKLYEAVLPMLVVRPLLCGAGKVGSEVGGAARFQASQRADFISEAINAETLYRRPIFNTRDEPHADPAKWMRLHVIVGDANLSLAGTARKLALVKLAIQLAIAGEAPVWKVRDPVAASKLVSRAIHDEVRIELEGGSWTTPEEIFESYFSAAEALGWLQVTDEIGPDRQDDPYLAPFLELFVVHEARDLLRARRHDFETFARSVEWAAKLRLYESFANATGGWDESRLRSLDLEFSDVDRESSLYWGLVQQGDVVDTDLPTSYVGMHLGGNATGTRSEVRSYAATRFGPQLANACWRTLTLKHEDREIAYDLPPDWRGSTRDWSFESVESFAEWLESIQ